MSSEVAVGFIIYSGDMLASHRGGLETIMNRGLGPFLVWYGFTLVARGLYLWGMSDRRSQARR